MEKLHVSSELSPREQLDSIIGKYLNLLSIYQSWVTSKTSDRKFLSIVAECVADAKEEVGLISESLSDQALRDQREGLRALDLIITSWFQTPEKDFLFEDFTFSFPRTIEKALAPVEAN